jgi:hypothetical protein
MKNAGYRKYYSIRKKRDIELSFFILFCRKKNIGFRFLKTVYFSIVLSVFIVLSFFINIKVNNIYRYRKG